MVLSVFLLWATAFMLVYGINKMTLASPPLLFSERNFFPQVSFRNPFFISSHSEYIRISRSISTKLACLLAVKVFMKVFIKVHLGVLSPDLAVSFFSFFSENQAGQTGLHFQFYFKKFLAQFLGRSCVSLVTLSCY